MVLIIILLSVWVLGGQALVDQNFTYSLYDNITIPYEQVTEISNSLTISSFEFVEHGQIELSITFQQANIYGTTITYDIIYFNMGNEGGRQCYFEYFNNSTLPQNSVACENAYINDDLENEMNCTVFFQCNTSTFSYKLSLSQIQSKQNIILVQNKYPIYNKAALNISTHTVVSVQNSNIWFYLSVALTCCLLLSLVLLTGVVLFWSLKYRKARRQLEEIKLTQIDSQISSIRKSMRKSLMKTE